jgi:hypothetical protein
LAVDPQAPFSMEYMKRMAVATKDAVTATVCFGSLKEEVVHQIMNDINFEDMKARAIEIIFEE